MTAAATPTHTHPTHTHNPDHTHTLDHDHDHDHEHDHEHDHAAGWVRGHAVPAREVDELVTRLRNGPRAAVLPVEGSPEGRQLRRWVAQTVLVQRLLEDEHRRIGEGDVELPPPPSVTDVVPDHATAVALGGVVAAVMRRSAPARAVWELATADVRVEHVEVTAYVRRNPGATEPEAAQSLLRARRRERFLDWLAAEQARGIQLAPGYEHPGDPSQPDATHRH